MQLAFIEVAEKISKNKMVDGRELDFPQLQKCLKTSQIEPVTRQCVLGYRPHAERFKESFDVFFQALVLQREAFDRCAVCPQQQESHGARVSAGHRFSVDA